MTIEEDSGLTTAMTHKKGGRKTLIVVAILATIAVFKISVVSVGDRSAGHTAIIWKDDGTASLRLFDSAKAACERNGQVGFLCEGRLAIVIQDRGLRLVGLPYLAFYSWLVGGR